ncbi:MAG: tryptophan 7-halogenase [Bryobacterales bacterium]
MRADDLGRWDVIIFGGGLAGLTLARQLLLETDSTVLLVDHRDQLPGPHQKVGESLVQLGGYYLSKVLQLEEHLFTRHFLKYNLRFHWPTPDCDNQSIEDYSVSFIRTLSNIPTFQLDRNLLEAYLLEQNSADKRFRAVLGARRLDVDLAEDGPHEVRWADGRAEARWVVDAAGRGGVLRRKLEIEKPSPIRHGSTWCWVDGLVDIEKLTSRTPSEVRHDPRRRQTGHFPQFLATNHFCAESEWLWVIPLHGKTSLGLVYDRETVDANAVSTGRKMLDYASAKWPALARDLPQRRIVDEGRLLDFSYDCRSALSAQGWAATGEAARFSDPLYSPATDLIAIHNTIITDCIRRGDDAGLEERCRTFDVFLRTMYDAYVPSYAVSYDCLGDQETFTLKYSWELAVYFGFYVLPGVNGLFADVSFVRQFLRRFAALGAMNRGLQRYLSDYYQWKKRYGSASSRPILKDLYDITPLRESERLFYETGLSAEEAIETLDRHLDRLREFARFIAAHVSSEITGNSRLRLDPSFVGGLKVRKLELDLERLAGASELGLGAGADYPWRLDPFALDEFTSGKHVLESVR